MSTGLWSSADPRLLNLISETCPVCSPLWWNERGTPTCHSAGRTHPQTLWWSSSVSSSPLWSSTAVPGARACGRQGVFNWWLGDMDLGGTQYSTLDFDLVVFLRDYGLIQLETFRHWLLQTSRSLPSSINRPHMMRAWANCCSCLINHRTTCVDTHAHESRCRNRGLCQCRLHWKPQTRWVIPDWGLQHRFRFKGIVQPRMLEIVLFTAVA